MPRIFTGIEIPTEIGAQLQLLRGGLHGARWVEPENYHITLRFIGDIDDATAHEIVSLLARVRRAPFALRLTGLSSFGGRKPRAIIASVELSRELAELQAEHERLMQRAGLASEGRKYAPHVTLARLRDVSSREVADYLAMRGYFQPLSFDVERFVLYSARASTGGGPYVVEADFPLLDRQARRAI